jgi:hypothetical protein
MCPFCLATAAVIAGSATGTGGLTAFIAGTILKRNKRKILPQNEAKEVGHGNDDNRSESSEDRFKR